MIWPVARLRILSLKNRTFVLILAALQVALTTRVYTVSSLGKRIYLK